jgi:hypothetical protein
MVISEHYKYIFIQNEKTASSAIAKELIENYDGKYIMWKHANYSNLKKDIGQKRNNYFIFSGLRNPLDIIVSMYYLRKIGKGTKHSISNFREHSFIKNNDATFQQYFKKIYSHIPYTCWDTKDFNKLDYIYHYETIQEDFKYLLEKLGLEQKRPLPIFNVTPNKNKNFLSYYTEDIQSLAKMSFGRYMNKWNYHFPKDWKQVTKNQKIFRKPILEYRYIANMVLSFFYYDYVTRFHRLNNDLRKKNIGTYYQRIYWSLRGKWNHENKSKIHI